jgi:uncharacterized membrane protein YbhN (UPF0104 family)
MPLVSAAAGDDIAAAACGAAARRPLGTWLSGRVQRGLPGLAALSNLRTLLRTCVLSIVQWSCIIVAIWLSVRAVGHEVTVRAAIGVWVRRVLGLTLPLSPAQLGTTQLAYMLGLSLTGTNDEVAFAASVVYVWRIGDMKRPLSALVALLPASAGALAALPQVQRGKRPCQGDPQGVRS